MQPIESQDLSLSLPNLTHLPPLDKPKKFQPARVDGEEGRIQIKISISKEEVRILSKVTFSSYKQKVATQLPSDYPFPLLITEWLQNANTVRVELEKDSQNNFRVKIIPPEMLSSPRTEPMHIVGETAPIVEKKRYKKYFLACKNVIQLRQMINQRELSPISSWGGQEDLDLFKIYLKEFIQKLTVLTALLTAFPSPVWKELLGCIQLFEIPEIDDFFPILSN